MTISVRLNEENEADLDIIKTYLKHYGIKNPSKTKIIKALLSLEAELITKRNSSSLMVHYHKN